MIIIYIFLFNNYSETHILKDPIVQAPQSADGTVKTLKCLSFFNLSRCFNYYIVTYC